MKREFSYHCLRPGWARCNQVITSILLAALLAGLIPPPAARLLLPDVAAALVPTLPTVQAAPLAQVTGSNVLTITKSVVGGGSGPFNVTVSGSNGYNNATTVSPGTPTVLNSLLSGVYTVTESSPGTGWSTNYAVTSGTGTASANNAVVTLQNSGGLAPFALNATGATTLPSTYPVVIMDDEDAGFTMTAGWFNWDESGYNGDDRQTSADNSGDLATWTFSGLTPGYYQVATTWLAQSNRTTAASYSVIGVTTSNVSVNQQAAPNDLTASDINWEYLTQNIQVGATGVLTVRLSDAPAQSGRFAIADAVRIQRLREFTTNQITGMVYRDYNSDGQWTVNTDIQEDGVSGVTVTLYDSNSSLLATTTTGSDGVYTFNSVTASGPFRVVFSNLPSGYEPTTHGTANGTSAQFVTSAAQAASVNLGILYPDDYAQNSPQLATSLLRNSTDDLGFPTTLSVVKYDLSSFQPITYPSYLLSDPNGTRMSSTTIALRTAVGNVNGLAWQRSTKTLFQAAYLRGQATHAPLPNNGLGPSGLGAIYMTTNSGATSLLATVSNVGTIVNSVASVGKVGLGDIELSADENTLYAVNLFAKTLVAIPLTGNPPTAGVQTQTALPQPADCTTAETHPFGLGQHRGKLYIGMVCGGPNLSNLRAYVYEYNGAAFSQKLNFSMNYPRTYNEGQNNLWPSGNPRAAMDINHNAVVWNDTPSANLTNHVVGSTVGADEPRFAPMLTDIVFDGSDMVLGFRSRTADQVYDAEWTIGGELLRACANSLLTPTTWVLENNGNCNGKTSLYPPQQLIPGPGIAMRIRPVSGLGAKNIIGAKMALRGKRHRGGWRNFPVRRTSM